MSSRRLGVLALCAGLLAILLAPISVAGAVPTFHTCSQVKDRYPKGVAKSVAAADAQVEDDYYRPQVKPAVYRASRSLDYDRDGSLCEVRSPWMTMPTSVMPNLEFMDSETGTSLTVDGFESRYDTDDVYVSETMKLSDGTPVEGWNGEYYTDRLQPDTYTFTLRVEEPDHWDCSIYYPEGCVWFENNVEIYVWRFYYLQEPGVIRTASKVSYKMHI